MKKLNTEELLKIEGGSGGGLLILGLIALGTIIAGIIDGFTRPLACHE